MLCPYNRSPLTAYARGLWYHLWRRAKASYLPGTIGIGDLDAYFQRGRRLARQQNASAGTVLFNLLEEIMVRNTRPYIKLAYRNATIDGELVKFPARRLRTVDYSLGETYAGLYDEVVEAIQHLSLAPYMLESYRKPETIVDKERHQFETGREMGLVRIFRTRFLNRFEIAQVIECQPDELPDSNENGLLRRDACLSVPAQRR